MPDLQGAFNDCVRYCNQTSPHCLYSQGENRRTGGMGKEDNWTHTLANGTRGSWKPGNITGVTYKWFDCSGMMYRVLKDNGFKVGNFSTAGIAGALKGAGFVKVSMYGEWKPGDIIYYRNDKTGAGHTEMVYKGGQGRGITMGAHGQNSQRMDEASLAGNVSIRNSWSTAANWDKGTQNGLFRYTNGAADPGEVPDLPDMPEDEPFGDSDRRTFLFWQAARENLRRNIIHA